MISSVFLPLVLTVHVKPHSVLLLYALFISLYLVVVSCFYPLQINLSCVLLVDRTGVILTVYVLI